jgi:hypothetical protein
MTEMVPLHRCGFNMLDGTAPLHIHVPIITAILLFVAAACTLQTMGFCVCLGTATAIWLVIFKAGFMYTPS